VRFKAANLLASFRFAAAGIYYCMRTQRNMRIHVVVGAVALGLALWLDVARVEVALVAAVCTLVITMEMINTAIESAVDLYTHRRHPLAKIAKDVAAAAVLVSALNAVVVGALVLGPPLARLVSGSL
jgi:diacylglycerol kinase